jgi:hypothetical protein
MTIIFPTYIASMPPERSRTLVEVIEGYCQTDPKPFICGELPDDLGKSKSQLPQSMTFTSVSFSGTASGVSTTTLQYTTDGTKTF